MGDDKTTEVIERFLENIPDGLPPGITKGMVEAYHGDSLISAWREFLTEYVGTGKRLWWVHDFRTHDYWHGVMVSEGRLVPFKSGNLKGIVFKQFGKNSSTEASLGHICQDIYTTPDAACEAAKAMIEKS